MKKLFIIIFLLFLFNNIAKAKTYNIDSSTNTLEIKKDDKIILQLQENPTTGYMWKLINSQPRVLEEKSKKYIASLQRKTGASGYTKYIFKATNQGNTKLQGYYYRPWEKQPRKPDYILEINVK